MNTFLGIGIMLLALLFGLVLLIAFGMLYKAQERDTKNETLEEARINEAASRDAHRMRLFREGKRAGDMSAYYAQEKIDKAWTEQAIREAVARESIDAQAEFELRNGINPYKNIETVRPFLGGTVKVHKKGTAR